MSQTTQSAPFGNRMHYAWVMFAMTFIVLIGASGFRSAPGVLIVPLQDAFGWDRAQISLAVSINLILFGFMGPFAAAMMDRFGIRTVLTCALATVASAGNRPCDRLRKLPKRDPSLLLEAFANEDLCRKFEL